jgi:hypothetical protein
MGPGYLSPLGNKNVLALRAIASNLLNCSERFSMAFTSKRAPDPTFPLCDCLSRIEVRCCIFLLKSMVTAGIDTASVPNRFRDRPASHCGDVELMPAGRNDDLE